ncbi:hypothetical protein HWV62_28722 [Athelia sp. TMB]|nr:hypothetical protein HWV62_28722 [Athelia sp. TMB]
MLPSFISLRTWMLTRGAACTYSNPYYSQCLPGTAKVTSTASVITSTPLSRQTTSTTSHTGITSNPLTSSTPTSPPPVSTATGTVPWAAGTATLLPNQLWIRADEDPEFHFYLQSKILSASPPPPSVPKLTLNAADSPGDAVISNPATASQNQIVSGQLIQYLPSGGELYLGVYPNATGTTRLKLFWATAPQTNVTWAFQGDGVEGNVPGYTTAATGNFLACTDTSTTAPNIYLDLGAFDYLTPAGCASETLNYYNGATTVT